MKRRALLCLLPATLLPACANAAPPAVELLVELRWVDSALAAALQAGVRDGAVVASTAGTVSPRDAARVTATRAAPVQPLQRLQVLNGQLASLRLETTEPLQWTEPLVELRPDGSVRSVYAQPRERRVARRVAVTPTWPGGSAPVRVALEVDADGQALQSTLALPLDRWQTVARSGGPVGAATPGTVSSADAAGQPARELQLRVSVSPR